MIIDGVIRVAAGLALPTLVLAANDDCKHLLAHGYPDFPDPARLGSQPLRPGVDLDSPEFQAAETVCEKHERKALGLP